MRFVFKLCFFIAAFSLSQPLSSQMLSRAQVERNTAAIRRLLLYSHPAATQYINRDSLEQALADLCRLEGDSISRNAFEYKVRQVLHTVGCGHTNIHPYSTFWSRFRKNKKAPAKVLPFYFYTDGQQLWVRSALDSLQQQVPTGAAIRSINGIPGRQILNRLTRCQIPDGQTPTIGVHTLNQELFFNLFYYKFEAQYAYMQVEWENQDGSVQSSRLAAIPLKRALAAMPKNTAQAPKALYRAKYRRFYFHEDNPQIGVLRLESFSGRAGRMYRKTFRTLKAQKTPYLVIDVRDNLGGNFNDCMNLVRYVVDKPYKVHITRRSFRTWKHMQPSQYLQRLAAILRADVLNITPRSYNFKRVRHYYRFKPHRKNHYDGQVFILMNGWSASASSVMSAYMKELGGAICIGQETGGGAWSLNGMQIPTFRLPEGKLALVVPQSHLDFRLGPDNGRGVMPQHPIYYTIEDILEARDLEMEKVMELIKK